ADSSTEAYCLILIEAKDLLANFPPPPPEPFSGVVRIGTTLALKETGAPILASSRVGRPSFPWDKIEAEAERRRMAGELPSKLEAAVADMIVWCKKKYGKAPARTTLAAKLSRY